MNSKEKGITLIALVITIIVLLILAAISIATLTGENGILTKSNNAKIQNVVGKEKEQIGLAYDAAMADNYEKGDYTSGVTASQLEEHLKKQGQNVTVSGNITIKFNDTEHEYTVDGKTGVIEEKTTGDASYPENPEGIKWLHEEGYFDENEEWVDIEGTIVTGIDLTEYENFELTEVEDKGYMEGSIDLRN